MTDSGRGLSPPGSEDLVTALTSLVKAEGLGRLNLRRVAEEAGVSLRSAQRQFPSLNELIEAALLSIDAKNRAALASIAVHRDPIGQFAYWLTEGFRRDREQTLAELELFLWAARADQLRPAARRRLTNLEVVVSGWTDSRRTVRTVCAYVDGLLLQALVTEETPHADVVASAIRSLCDDERENT